MKKIFNIILSAAFLLGAISCTELLDQGFRNGKQAIPEGATVTVGFCVPSEVSTKGDFKDEPDIRTIHVLSFDEEGILVQAKKAELKAHVNKNYDGSENNGDDIYYSRWSVELFMSAQPRTLHFVANLPDDLVPSAGSEKTIFQSLASTEEVGCFWQTVTLEDGIQPYTYEGGHKFKRVSDAGVVEEKDTPGTPNDDGSYNDGHYRVDVGDYIDREGKKIVNGTGYYYVPEPGTPLTNKIYLVRNFARIRFTNSYSGFNVKQVILVNYPKAGFVAPYDNTTHDFVEAYKNIRTTGLVKPQEQTVNGETTTTYINHVQGYKPTLPDAGLETTFANFKSVETTASGTTQTATLYMYERGIPSAATGPATALLLGGTRSGSNTTVWIKVEIAKEDGSYFEIYRDMVYNMTVGNIDNSATYYNTAEDAYKNAPVGDISDSPEAATLTQITDGKGLVLWVHEIDHPELYGGNQVPLVYCFVFENKTTHAVLKDFHNKVEFTPMGIEGVNNDWATSDESDEAVTLPAVAAAGSAYASLIPTTEYYQGYWYYVLVNLKTYSSVLQSMIRVTGSVDVSDFGGESYAENKSLHRDVTYTVLSPSTLKLQTSQLASDAAEKDVTLTIELPTTLARGVFPLTFKIEAENNNITPKYTTVANEKMPAEVGESSFTSGRSTYYFLRTVSYDEYKASTDKKFECKFLTTKATGITPVTRIHVEQKVEEGGKQWFVTDPEAIVDLKTTGVSVYPSTGN